MKKLILLRRVSQAFFVMLFIYILWSTTYPLKGILPPETFFKANPLIMVLTSVSERILIPGTLISLTVILLSLIFGRFFCGWICPLGAMIDLSCGLKRKRKVPSDAANRIISSIKVFVLSALTLLAFAGIQAAWALDPMVIMARFVSLNLIPTITLAIDSLFIFMIKSFNMYGWLYDIYRGLKAGLLGVKVSYFANSLYILFFFIFILLSTYLLSRFWCRAICPLGAVYRLSSARPLIRRIVNGCTECGICRSRCRMGAIRSDISTVNGECILCMDCVYDCPQQAISFGIPALTRTGKSGRASGGSAGKALKDPLAPRSEISRKDFLFILFSGIFLAGLRSKAYAASSPQPRDILRPPGATDEKQFINSCIRCGNCMKVCPTNVLQPAILQSGISGLWTPNLLMDIGYCEYNCNLCGDVCPTGAIPRIPLVQKKKEKLGLARIDKKTCIAWADDKECIVCQEHCPIPQKAIKVKEKIVGNKRIFLPSVDEELCIGCGICQFKCPVRPKRAITVHRLNA